MGFAQSFSCPTQLQCSVEVVLRCVVVGVGVVTFFIHTVFLKSALIGPGQIQKYLS